MILQWLIARDIDKVFDLARNDQKEKLRHSSFLGKKSIILHF